MTTAIQELSPSPLWKHFADLNAVPRPSKKEERVIDFMMNFGKSLGLTTSRDEIGNVLISKPASAGREDRPTVALQSHLDMVHQKNSDTDFDFSSQGIQMLVENDWVKADGTTLGADNGIGVAAMMAVLASNELVHPPLEALFTIDEETGMTGAKGLKGGWLKATYLLNLDTEDDDELTIGCAGGVDIEGKGSYPTEAVPEGHSTFRLSLTGLRGGHSGMDIHLGRGNANKLMNRLLYRLQAKVGARLSELDGGGLRNAIPRESFAVITVAEEKQDQLRALVGELESAYQVEYSSTDPGLRLQLEPAQAESVAGQDFLANFLRALYALPSGIYRMSPEVEGLVQTSNNLARVEVKAGEFSVVCLSRGSVDSEKMDLAQTVSCALELAKATVKFEGAYPGWAPRPESDIVKIMSSLYRELFADEPHIKACHAGLECGILGQNYPEMQMISFGPNIVGPHSPDERVQISSVQKFWKLLTQTLARL